MKLTQLFSDLANRSKQLLPESLNPDMSLTKILPWLNRFGLVRLIAGKHAALVMYVSSLIVDAYEKRTTTKIVREVYRRLPAEWKAPNGPATEDELNDAIKQGVLFDKCLHALARK